MSKYLCFISLFVVLSCRTINDRRDYFISTEQNELIITQKKDCENNGGTWKSERCFNRKPQCDTGLEWDGLSCVSSLTVKNFYRYCVDPESSPEILHLVDVLLAKASTDDCNLAFSKFRQLRELDLSNKKIESIAALVGFSSLKVIKIEKNNLNDLFELKFLPQLEEINAADNKISAVNFLLGGALPFLKRLDLSRNPISDRSPLTGRDIVVKF